jgi:crossover junction endodeoxyribonuclease RuvC
MNDTEKKSSSREGLFVMGFDPGTLKTGFGVLEIIQGQLSVANCGVWYHVPPHSKKTLSLGERLEDLSSHVERLLRLYNPVCVGLECAVVFKNPLSALKLAEARGVIRLVCHQVLSEAQDRFFEISPTAVKKNISGFGSSKKKNVESSVLRRFGIHQSFGHEEDTDAYDAIAVAFSAWKASKRKLIISKGAQNIKT